MENEAEKLLNQFDPERLRSRSPSTSTPSLKSALGVDYDWKYITPDQSILGATAFNAGYVWVWPEPCYREGMLPSKVYLSKGSILIDATLTEGDNRGRENFTVMHEVFHQVLHKNCFRRETPDYIHSTTQIALNGKKSLKTSLDFIEYQANACAAAFLMPQNVVRDEFKKRSSNLGAKYPFRATAW
ncbi:MAG: ImmA/IrrE family metallo-endopeptidase [Oscillospiraceae bacterium]